MEKELENARSEAWEMLEQALAQFQERRRIAPATSTPTAIGVARQSEGEDVQEGDAIAMVVRLPLFDHDLFIMHDKGLPLYYIFPTEGAGRLLIDHLASALEGLLALEGPVAPQTLKKAPSWGDR